MTQIHVDLPENLVSYVGFELGPTDWVSITPKVVIQFAGATRNNPKILPQGSPVPTILPVALIGKFISELVDVGDYKLRVNYGLNNARFLTPIFKGDRIRALISIGRVTETGSDYVEVEFNVVIEVEGKPQPGSTVIVIYRYYK
ncbi:MAG TPA: hypothetical protein VKK79_18595 [Candidatus Lokiarchaeia archaeon]|nr:hypothetical protein [Candidatus Lokiarchaeia archaeon]